MINYEAEKRRQMRLEKLGTNHPVCGTCGEVDDRCFEKHHVAGRKRDGTTVLICANCHRKVTDSQKDHPNTENGADPMLDRIGHFLLGLADMLALVVERLKAFGLELIELAKTSTAAEGARS